MLLLFPLMQSPGSVVTFLFATAVSRGWRRPKPYQKGAVGMETTAVRIQVMLHVYLSSRQPVAASSSWRGKEGPDFAHLRASKLAYHSWSFRRVQGPITTTTVYSTTPMKQKKKHIICTGWYLKVAQARFPLIYEICFHLLGYYSRQSQT